MSTIITGLIGIVLIVTFLGFMVVWVKALPLIVIVVGVLSLLVYDFWLSVRGQANNPYRR